MSNVNSKSVIVCGCWRGVRLLKPKRRTPTSESLSSSGADSTVMFGFAMMV